MTNSIAFEKLISLVRDCCKFIFYLFLLRSSGCLKLNPQGDATIVSYCSTRSICSHYIRHHWLGTVSRQDASNLL